MTDYLKFYDLEKYLFEDVARRFRESHELEPLDLFLIFNWKSIRAKNRNKDKLKKIGGTFEVATKKIVAALLAASSPEDRLKILMKNWELRLPTATAVLTVLYPEEFTVYDVRVRKQLGLDRIREDYSEAHWDAIWNSYFKFKDLLIEKAPPSYSLRDKDRYFWGKSFLEDAVSACECSARRGD